MSETKPLLTCGDIAKIFKISRVNVPTFVKRYKIPRIKLGHRFYRFLKADIDNFIATRSKWVDGVKIGDDKDEK